VSDLTNKMRDAMYEATDDAEDVGRVQLLDAALVAALRALHDEGYALFTVNDRFHGQLHDPAGMADEIEASS
jgi:hypothetical protein